MDIQQNEKAATPIAHQGIGAGMVPMMVQKTTENTNDTPRMVQLKAELKSCETMYAVFLDAGMGFFLLTAAAIITVMMAAATLEATPLMKPYMLSATTLGMLNGMVIMAFLVWCRTKINIIGGRAELGQAGQPELPLEPPAAGAPPPA